MHAGPAARGERTNGARAAALSGHSRRAAEPVPSAGSQQRRPSPESTAAPVSRSPPSRAVRRPEARGRRLVSGDGTPAAVVAQDRPVCAFITCRTVAIIAGWNSLRLVGVLPLSRALMAAGR